MERFAPGFRDCVMARKTWSPAQMEERDANLVGGDIYDIMETAYGTRVILADVEGKGLPALGAAMAVVGSFREAAHRESTLTGLVEGIVDLTATGSTLRENGLVVREEIAECTARLIANPVAHKLKAAAIDTLLERLGDI